MRPRPRPRPIRRIPPTCRRHIILRQRQQGKKPTHHRPCNKINPRRILPRNRIIQIRQRSLRGRLVDEPRDIRNKALFGGRLGDGGGEELPVGFGVGVAGVEGDAVFVGDGGVEGGLHVVDGGGDEGGVEQGVGVEVVEEAGGVGLAVGEGGVLGRRLVF